MNQDATGSKYYVLTRPHYEPSLSKESFDTVHEAVKYALDMMSGSDFLVVQIVDWKAEEHKS